MQKPEKEAGASGQKNIMRQIQRLPAPDRRVVREVTRTS